MMTLHARRIVYIVAPMLLWCFATHLCDALGSLCPVDALACMVAMVASVFCRPRVFTAHCSQNVHDSQKKQQTNNKQSRPKVPGEASIVLTAIVTVGVLSLRGLCLAWSRLRPTWSLPSLTVRPSRQYRDTSILASSRAARRVPSCTRPRRGRPGAEGRGTRAGDTGGAATTTARGGRGGTPQASPPGAAPGP